MRRTVVAALALGLAASPVLLTTPAFADTTPTTGTICGYAWNDLNGDGGKQAGEPAIQTSMSIVGDAAASGATDQNGHYCLTGVPFGNHQVQFNDLAMLGGYAYTKMGGDSVADWHTGTSHFVRLDAGAPTVDNFDAGYVKGANDIRANEFTASPAGGLKVGDTVHIEGFAELTGNVPDDVMAKVQLPDGLTVTGTFGEMSASLDVAAHGVSGAWPGRLDPGREAALGVVAVVTAPMDDATVTFTADQGLYPDTNPANNVQTIKISAAAAPPAGTTTTPPTTTTTTHPVTTHPVTTTSSAAAAVPTTSSDAGTGTGGSGGGGPLPYTGVSLGVPIAAGSGLVAAGVAGLWFIRRRRAV